MKLNIEELAKQADELADIVFNGKPHSANEWHKERDKAITRLIVERCAQEATKNANVFPDDGQATAGVINSAIRNLMED